MSVNKPAWHQILIVGVVLIVCAVLLFAITPATLAAESGSVSVKVTVGPCIHVSPDGSIRSNVSTVSLEGNDLLTVLAR